MTGLLAGVDVGTTNCKVGFHATDGTAVVEWRRPTPRDADDVVTVVLDGLRYCLDRAGQQPLAVGITGVAEGGVPVDGALRPLRPLLWWHEAPASAEARWLADRVGRTALFATTGVDVSPKTPLATWLWLRRHQPDTVDGMRAWLGVPEYVASVLCGTPLTHRTFAGRSGAFDQFAEHYDENLLAMAGVRVGQLPEAANATATTSAGDVLRVGTPVAVAGHDHLVAAHAAGAREAGDVVDSLGTAEAVVTVSERAAPEASAGTGMSWNRTVDGRRWAMVSAFPHSGRLLDWLRSLSSPAGDDEGLERLAASVPDRPTGIVVLPYLAGLAAPAPDPHRKLSVHDLAAGHALHDVVVAGLEGACFHTRWMAECQAGHSDTKLGEVAVLGGASRGRAWMHIRTHVLPGPVRSTETADAACAGSALLAGEAVGLPSPVLRSEVLARDELLADRYDAIYRDGFLSRVREVA